LATALAGGADNWLDLGGPDRPLILHGLAGQSDVERVLAARLGKAPMVAVEHADLTSLATAVARDPWALAMTGQAVKGAAKALNLTDSCGFPLQATPFAVKAEDYPLTLPVYLLTPPRRLPLMARDFLDFLATPLAQDAIDRAGYISRNPQLLPLSGDGLRLMSAVQAAGQEISLADLQRLVVAMQGAERLSMTFRFEDGSDRLDPVSTENLNDLAQRLEAGLIAGQDMTLVGFSDGSGAAMDNLALSSARARSVLSSLSAMTKGVTLPQIVAFGETLPMACDQTAAGRRLNRRVEIWIR
jgi:phosphate transport system substrate-binding protein